jgi:C1A family cysteine protease
MRKYGWKKDPIDVRDFKYKAPARLLSALPPKVDWREFQSPVENQGSLGSCTGQGFAAALEYLDRRGDGKHTDVSRLFIYQNELMIYGVIEDTGAYIRDGIKVLAKYGVCDEALWPYDISKFKVKPPLEAYKDALKRRLKAYYRVSTVQELKAAIAEGLPVVFGTAIFSGFEGREASRTGIVSMPDKSERSRGGHCMVIVGYDDARQCFIVKNSWGVGVGDAGYYYIPYAYMEQFASDFWALQGEGLPCSQDEPFDPIPSDTEWYLPIVSIIKGAIRVWEWIFSTNKLNGRTQNV